MMRTRAPRAPLIAALVLFNVVASRPAAAQSPDTAALTVLVTDQSGAAVPDASVHVVNPETGAERTLSSGADGGATATALPLTGRYDVRVSRSGFADGQVADLVLRAGESARVTVVLRASCGTSEVTVYGTAGRVGTDPQLGTRLTSERIEETPLLGRKAS